MKRTISGIGILVSTPPASSARGPVRATGLAASSAASRGAVTSIGGDDPLVGRDVVTAAGGSGAGMPGD